MKTWKWWQKGLVGLGIVLGVALLYIFWPQGVWPFTVNLDHIAPPEGTYEVTILRDSWGVPHIFGERDADAAYGLAYAHAEDDFTTIQETMLATRAMSASVFGADAAPIDYAVHLLRIWDTVEAEYGNIPAEYRAIMDAYADGINHYAALHEEELFNPSLFPVTGADVLAGFLLKTPLFFGLDSTIGDIFAAERQQSVSEKEAAGPLDISTYYGSNFFAVSPQRSAAGETFLSVNTHQPWSGPATWYEAHLHSEEGLDMFGGLLPGSPLVNLGHNRHLGWSFTVNHPDLVDVYVLEINPDNPDQYRFDGEWLDLETETVTLWVRLGGRLVVPVQQEVLWSVYGPTARQDHGTYAIRYAGMGEVDHVEQFLRMNKATTLAEWQAAMREGPLPMFNTGYADKEGNILYVYNGLLPLRAEGYDWHKYLPGDTSETLWTEYLPYDDLPQVLNPPSGFIQNANSTPYQTTIGTGNPEEADYSSTFGIETFMTNRALRALSLFGIDESITAEDFYTYKYDMTYHPDSDVVQVVQMLLEHPPNSADGDETDIETALSLLADWDYQATPDSQGATVALLTFYAFNEVDSADLNASRLVNSDISLKVAQDGFLEAVNWLREHFGQVTVPWQDVNRMLRGDQDLGLGGGPDLLHAVYGERQADGRLNGFVGDSHIMLIEWDENGNVHSQSIHQYGSATVRDQSPHYADQAPLFANRQLKPVWLDEADIRADLEREYRPGEE